MTEDVNTEPTPAKPSRLPRAFSAATKWLLGVLWALVLIFLLICAGFYGWIVPGISTMRSTMETQATKILGVPVKIGAIRSKGAGLVPSFELDNVTLLDKQGHAAVRLPRTTVSLSPMSIWSLGFEQLIIERPEVDVRRTVDGRLFVGGLDFNKPGGDNKDATKWFFSQPEFLVKNGILRWTDEMRRSPPLALSGLNFAMRNSSRNHDFELEGTPPEGWGQRFHLNAALQQPLLSMGSGTPQTWDGTVLADFPKVDVAQLRNNISLGGASVEMNHGSGSLNMKMEVHQGQIVGGGADVALLDASARLGKGLEPLAMKFVKGRVTVKRLATGSGDGFELAANDLSFETPEGLRWAGGNVLVRQWGDPDQAEGKASNRSQQQGDVVVDQVNLYTVAQLASRLPLGASVHKLLMDNSPRGMMNQFSAHWQGDITAGIPQSYLVKGKITDLEVVAKSEGSTAPVLSNTTTPTSLAQTEGSRNGTLNFEVNQTGNMQQGNVSADKITVNSLLQIAGNSSAGSQIHQLMNQNAVRGTLNQFMARWQGDVTAGTPKLFQLKGKITDLDMVSRTSQKTAIPKLVQNSASVDFDINQSAAGQQGDVVVENVDLNDLVQLVSHTPMADTAGSLTNKLLNENTTQGTLHDFHAHWQGDAITGMPKIYEAKGKITGLNVLARQSGKDVPPSAVSGASVDFSINQAANAVQQGRVMVEALDISSAAQLVSRLPLSGKEGTPLYRLLHDNTTKGMLNQFQASWQGDLTVGMPKVYEVKGKLVGLDVVARSSKIDSTSLSGKSQQGVNADFNISQSENSVQQGTVLADVLDLSGAAQLANRLMPDVATDKMLNERSPKGVLRQLTAHWQGDVTVEMPKTYAIKGKVSGLEVASQASEKNGSTPQIGSPGLRGASGDFEVNQSGGSGNLLVQNGMLSFPGIFEQADVPMDSLSAQFSWQMSAQSGGVIKVQVPSLKFANADAQGQLNFEWQTSNPGQSFSKSRFPGVLNLTGELSRGVGARVYRYLPLAIAADARHYVQDAITKGDIQHAKFRVKGDLWEMPFADPKRGDFNITTQLANVSYAYAPVSTKRGSVAASSKAVADGKPKVQPVIDKEPTRSDALAWPAISDMSGELVIDRESLFVSHAKGLYGNRSPLLIENADAKILKLDSKAVVSVNAHGKGALEDWVKTVNTSPVANMTSHVLARTKVTGMVDLDLKLTLPLSDLNLSKVQGVVSLQGNDVQITPSSPLLGQATGKLSFNETGFNLDQVKTNLLGGEVQLEGGMKPSATAKAEPLIEIKAQGIATAKALQAANELGPVTDFAKFLSGSALYSATLGFKNGIPEISVVSQLHGMAINLPAPLNKAEEVKLPLHVVMNVVSDASIADAHTPAQATSPATWHEKLSIDLGNLASVVYIREMGGAQSKVLRGGIAVGTGEPAIVPDEGVLANINATQLDADAWIKIMTPGNASGSSSGTTINAASLTASSPKAPASVSTVEATASSSNYALAVPPGSPTATRTSISPERAAMLSYMPSIFALQSKDILLKERHWHNIVAGGSRDGLTWRLNLEAKELNGYGEFRQPTETNAGRVFVRLARLTVPKTSAAEVEQVLAEDTARIPALDIEIENLELFERKLGRLEVQAVNRSAQREWRINKIKMTTPEGTLSASGNWTALNSEQNKRQTNMNFTMDIEDAGKFLDRIGQKDVLLNGKGNITGKINWMGSPLVLDYPTLSGELKLDMGKGQFLQADPGVARLLGVLSLQSIVKRLNFDFRDVFSKGFAFDAINGDAVIAKGLMRTDNLEMKGLNAKVLIDGKVDLAKTTQDLRVVIEPEINAGLASLGAAVINPVLGLATLATQLAFRPAIIAAATKELHVTGTWGEPKVAEVKYKPRAKKSTELKQENNP